MSCVSYLIPIISWAKFIFRMEVIVVRVLGLLGLKHVLVITIHLHALESKEHK